jgi:long-chain fatty acid transport protein
VTYQKLVRKTLIDRLMLCLILLTALCFTGQLAANNAMNPHGYGTKNKAMGGAGIAFPRDAAAVINNPATAVAVAGKMQAGISVYHPRMNYYSTESDKNGEDGAFTIGPNEIDGEKKYLLQPYFAESVKLQENSAVAVSLYTRAGMNTYYRGGTATFDPDGDGPEPVQTLPGTFGDGDTRWKMYQTLLDMTYARQVSDKVSLGITGVLAAQKFRIEGVQSWAPLTQTYAASGGEVMPQDLSGNRNDWTYGAGLKVGLHAQLTRTISLGFMYQSKIYMGKHKDYSDLLPDNGSFDMPANIKFGFTWQPLDVLAFSLDFERIANSKVDALGNSMEDLLECPTAGHGGTDLTKCLGGKNGGGLGWDSTNIYKIGGSWSITNKWMVLAGFSVTDQPVSLGQTTNNMLTPYLAEAHYTFGITYTLDSGADVNFSAAYSEEESQGSPNVFDPSQIIKIESDQFDLELSYSWRF